MITLPPDYRPSEDEEFMNPLQTEYFRQKLLKWRADLLKEAGDTLASLSEGGIHEADITDRASVETDRALELRTRDRARKLIGKINLALQRVENGSYGYCEETGEPIGLKRLEARPIATLSIEAQEQHERMEKHTGTINFRLFCSPHSCGGAPKRLEPRKQCCCSSVVEHSLGKGEVDSSILSSSTSTPPLHYYSPPMP